MSGFSISEFKSFAADLIKSAGIDLNNNGKIEAGAEMEKLCSVFNIEPEQIGDLLEVKQPTATTQTVRGYSDKELERQKTHEKYLESKEEYKNMSAEQRQKVCEKTIQQELENISNLDNVVNHSKPLVGYPLGIQLQDMGDDFKDKDKVIAKITSYVNSKIGATDKDIEKYDKAFKEYDSTYETLFYRAYSSGQNGVNDVKLDKMTREVTENLIKMINKFAQSDLTERYEQKVMEFAGEIEAEISKMNIQIEMYKDIMYEKYDNDSNDSLDSLAEQQKRNTPEELDIKGTPVEKVFIKVIDETSSSTTGINNIRPTGDPKDGPIYNMMGQRVNGNLQKGHVYIQNGQKFVAQ